MQINYTEIEVNETEIILPASKSMSNRALIMQALCNENLQIINLSEAEDTKVLAQNLLNKSLKKNVGIAGTAARFLCAYLAIQKSTYILDAAPHMKQRPMKELFDSLVSLSCEINYLENEYCLPTSINGNNTTGGSVHIAANISSQFISALMMIAPVLNGGLKINLQGAIASEPYILLTKSMMEQQGILVTYSENFIEIKEQKYKNTPINIEADWSSASYIFSALALLDEGSILLKNTNLFSLQGDAVVAEIYHSLGIKTSANEDDVLLEKTEHYTHYLEYDFTPCPDLAQTVICTCVGMSIEGKFYGLHTLYNKETNRVLALQNELKKFNYSLEKDADDFYHLQKIQDTEPLNKIIIHTYNDHRMAMAFTPLCVIFGEMEIENPDVVKKSFPSFWEEMKKLGIA